MFSRCWWTSAGTGSCRASSRVHSSSAVIKRQIGDLQTHTVKSCGVYNINKKKSILIYNYIMMNNYELPRAHIQCMLLLWVATNEFAMVHMVKGRRYSACTVYKPHQCRHLNRVWDQLSTSTVTSFNASITGDELDCAVQLPNFRMGRTWHGTQHAWCYI